MMKNKMRALVWMALMVTGMASAAWADCTSPAGKEGDQIYASGQKTMVFCNGTDWMAMGSSSTGGGGVSGNISVSNISVTTNVSVTGTVSMGWERITGSAGGSSTASCSAGKIVVGGGCSVSGNYATCVSGDMGGFFYMTAPSGYPSSVSAYTCACPASLSMNANYGTTTVTAYALCARIGS